jgi:hypothetical protein
MRLVELNKIFERMDLGVFRRLEIFVQIVLEIGHFFVSTRCNWWRMTYS